MTASIGKSKSLINWFRLVKKVLLLDLSKQTIRFSTKRFSTKASSTALLTATLYELMVRSDGRYRDKVYVNDES